MASVEQTLYDALGLTREAKEVEIRRAYRNLATRAHPDKGGDANKFKEIQRAYDVLSVPEKRKEYDRTGRVQKTVDEEFMESFGGGSYRDSMRKQEDDQANMAEQLTVRQTKEFSSHTAGFEAWMRSRGDKDKMVFGVDDVIEQYGVEKCSYDVVPIPNIKAYTVTCEGGKPADAFSLVLNPLPEALEWGQVLISMRAAPISPADIYTSVLGGAFGSDSVVPPYVAGHDGVGVVQKIGPGVKDLAEGDWVLPFKTHLGTWRSLLVATEKDFLKVPEDLMPMEYMAMWREMCAAYRLLEDQKYLQPGDCVILNAANSTVGQTIIQLCRLLRLRCIATVRGDTGGVTSKEKLKTWLTSLGATHVIFDEEPLRTQLEELKFYAKPKLALDGVGGHSAVKLAEELAEGGHMVVYGCISGKSPMIQWQQWVFSGLKVSGFNLRKWMKENKQKIPSMLEAMSKLVKADKIQLEYTDYELGTEFTEALEHHLDHGRNTKILLKVNTVGEPYGSAVAK